MGRFSHRTLTNSLQDDINDQSLRTLCHEGQLNSIKQKFKGKLVKDIRLLINTPDDSGYYRGYLLIVKCLLPASP